MMEKSVTRVLMCTLGCLCIVGGENVMVRVLREPSVSQSCIYPSTTNVTILRHDRTDVTLSLQANQIVITPSHVVLMSSDNTTKHIEYQRTKVSQSSQAYHNVEKTASFVVRCFHYGSTKIPYFIIEGTFFYEYLKFMLKPVLDVDVIVGPIDVTSHYVMKQVEEFRNPQDHRFIETSDLNKESVTPITDAQSTERKLRRSKRQTKNYYIDVLPVVDYHLYEMWLTLNNNDAPSTASAISEYMANVFTSMSLRLKTLSLRNNMVLKLRMVTPHLATSASASPYSEVIKEPIGDGKYRIDAYRQLEHFKGWIANNDHLPTNDHTMLFTGYTIYGGGDDGELGNNLTRGLSYIGEICQTDGSSCSVVQDLMAYQSEPVAVHELGHSLGSKHDGQGNKCSSYDRFIMSNGSYRASPEDVLHPFSFSTCSSDAISTKIEELEATSFLTTCLESETGSAPVDIRPLNGIDQCRALFGQESYVCSRSSSSSPITDICTGLYCYMPGTGKCRLLIPATGTCCRNGKYCIEGECVSAQAGQCVMNDVCPFEDQPGLIDGLAKTCKTMHSAGCYNESIRAKCCRTCESSKLDIAGCKYGDKRLGCKSDNCATTYPDGTEYSFYCCKTCAHTTTCQDKPGFIFEGQLHTCPRFIQTHGKHYCYFQDISIVECCRTCQEHKESNADCPYGDLLHKFNCSAIPALGRECTDKEKSLCCKTCPGIIVSTNTENTNPDTTSPAEKTDSDTTPQSCAGGSCGGAKSSEISRTSFYLVCVTVGTLCLYAML